MTDVSSLFGWSSLAQTAPPKIANVDPLFTNVSSDRQEIVVCTDCSGSTLFDANKAHDGKGFSEIYAEAMHALNSQLPKHKVICWSSEARELSGDELVNYNHLVENKIPIASTIKGMNGGTEPQNILPLVKGKTVVLVTDGEIGDNAILQIRNKLQASGIGNVFLIIVPHIDNYKDMYSNNKNVEVNVKDSIRLSIPQAFSERLATVCIWNYRSRNYEIISELTAPWCDASKTLSEIINNPVPVVPAGQFLIKHADHYKSFALDKLIDWLQVNNIDEKTIARLAEYDVQSAVRQQASVAQKDAWNLCIQTIFNKIVAAKVKNEFVETPIPADAPMLDRIRIVMDNEKRQWKLTDTYKKDLGEICGKILVNKSLAEIKSVGAAKAAQTVQNVSAFATMKQEDKLTEISKALVKGDCAICSAEGEVFKTIAIPCKLIVALGLCVDERVVNRKNKSQTIKTLNLESMKNALDLHAPRFHFLDLCSACANVSCTQAKAQGDPEYGITNLIPQNQVVGPNGQSMYKDRLWLCPIIAEDKMKPESDPNESKLSYSRQWLRGFISHIMGLEVAGQECLNACLLFLTSLAHSKEDALLVYPNQVSLLRGGRVDRYTESVGRLFKPTAKKISKEILTTIVLVSDVIEKAEMQVLPESNKLLLLCLLERNIMVLINAKKQRDSVVDKLKSVLADIKNDKGNKADVDKFGIPDALIADIKSSSDFYGENLELCNKLIATYLQNVMHININAYAIHERSLLKVLQIQSFSDVADGLGIHSDYLHKMVTRSGMTDDQFMQMIPQFVNAIVKSDQSHNMEIMMKHL